MAALSRDAILGVADAAPTKVEVPEWGGEVFVRVLSGVERDAFEQSCVVMKGKTQSMNLSNLRARLLVLTVCDEQGKPLFTPLDAESLGKKSGRALDRIFAVAQEVNGLSEKDVDALVKN